MQTLAHGLRVDTADEQPRGGRVPQIVEPRPRQLKLAEVSAEVGRDRPRRERLPDRVRNDDFEQLEGAPILLDGPTLVVRGHRVTHLRDTVRRP